MSRPDPNQLKCPLCKEDINLESMKEIWNAAEEGISVIDRDMKILWVNRMVEEWAGRLGDISDKNCYRVFQRRDEVCPDCPVAESLETGKVVKAIQSEYDREGKKRHFELTVNPVRDEGGALVAVAEHMVDITGKVASDSKVKEVKGRLQAIFDGISDGISVIDRDYRIDRVNLRLLKMFGKKAFTDLIGKKCYAEYHRRNRRCENCPVKRTFRTGRPSHSREMFAIGRKKKIFCDVSTFPIKDEVGETVQAIAYFKDITARRRLEEQLLQSEKMAGVGQLASGIAHELRNPLAIISASAQFCLTKFDLEKEAKEHLKVILRNLGNADRVVKELLDFARPTEISFTLGSIGKVLDRSCRLIEVKCFKQRVRLVKKCSRRLPEVMLDAKHLEEVFLNLMLNSLDAMPRGGTLRVKADLDQDKRHIIVTFVDTGCGISRKDLSKISNPFFTTKKRGIGLGLTVAHQIIGYHKGKIDIESTKEEGTRVTVKLPVIRYRLP